MKVIGIIPARGGSKGVPRKNIKLLGGKPLILYTIKSALESKRLDKLIVSTDDVEVRRISIESGVEVPFLRPETLAKDDSPTLPVIQHALKYFINKGEYFDAVCILQPTTPFRNSGLIDDAIAIFSDSDADSLISVKAVPHEYNPHWVFEVNHNGFLILSTGEKKIIQRRQELPKAFIRDGALYLSKTTTVLDKSDIYGDTISYIEHHSRVHINIDGFKDWELAEEFLRSGIEK